MENSYRYTDAGGTVRVTVTKDSKFFVVAVEDSSPGVPNESLTKLFDRLYRVDKSRSRAFGGSGLGLSICQNIVKAHKGSIIAKHSDLGGLKIEVTFPIQK